MDSYRYRYAVYGTAIAAAYCVLMFVLHYAVSSKSPGQLFSESPAAAILVLLSLPVSLLVGYVLGIEKDRTISATRYEELYRARSTEVEDISVSLERSEEAAGMATIAIQELKHPLTSIVGYALTLREYWDKLDDASKLEFVDYIKVSCSRLEGIANYMVRIIEAPRHAPRHYDEPFEIREIISEVSAILEGVYTERGLRVAVRFLGVIPLMRGDPSIFFDLVYNLLDICMRCSETEGMVSAWCSYKDGKTTLHLRCHHIALKPDEVAAIGHWPPQDSGGETATLAMQYRLADNMLSEIGAAFRMEAVGDQGLSLLVTFPSIRSTQTDAVT